MNLAKGRKLLLERIAPEEALTINVLNEDEVMLLLSEVYQDRISGPELQFYKIQRLKPIFPKKKKKKDKTDKKLKNEVACLRNELQNIKNLLKSHVKQPTQVKQPALFYKNQSIEDLRKAKLRDILIENIDKYQDTEITFMLSSVYSKKLTEQDKHILKLK